MGEKIGRKTMTHVPRSDYLGMITEIEAAEGRFGPNWNIIGTIKEGPHKGKEIAGYFPKQFTPRNKMGRLIKALLGREALKREVDTDELKGVLCYLVIEDHVVEDTDEIISKLMGVKKYEPGEPTN